jgi:SAM-dependent methyltransferase
LLAASLTGSTGSVLGIDRSDKAIVAAQARAEAASTGNIKFIASSVDDFSVEGQQFDMVIGRYVLCHQLDAVAFLKRTAKFVRRGGVIAFHEVDLARLTTSAPAVPLWDMIVGEVLARFQRACPEYNVAQKMIKTFVCAGLPVPKMSYELPVGGGVDSPLCKWITETLRSLSDNSRETRLPDGRFANIDELNQELQRAVAESHAQIEFPGQSCAWVQVRS